MFLNIFQPYVYSVLMPDHPPIQSPLNAFLSNYNDQFRTRNPLANVAPAVDTTPNVKSPPPYNPASITSPRSSIAQGIKLMNIETPELDHALAGNGCNPAQTNNPPDLSELGIKPRASDSQALQNVFETR